MPHGSEGIFSGMKNRDKLRDNDEGELGAGSKFRGWFQRHVDAFFLSSGLLVKQIMHKNMSACLH